MKIIHIIESLNFGGKERQLLELARGLVDKGVSSRIIVQSDAVQYDVSDLAEHIHLMPRRTRWDLGLINRMRRVVEDVQPDVIHSWGSMCSVYAVPVSGFGRIPFVSGHVRDAPSNLPWSDKRWWQGRIAEPFAAAVVANSKAGLEAYRVDRSKGHVIYNGFDFAGRTAAADPSFARAIGITTPYSVAMVARFGSHKDHNTYFDAADRILAQREDVCFLAIGDGPGFQEWHRRYLDNPRVQILGRRTDVERIVANVTLGVLATRVSMHGEGISNALTEILAAGKPVVATDDGGNGELVGGNDCGILVPPANPTALAAAIIELLDKPALAKKLGMAGQRAIYENFTQEAMVQSYLQLYADVIGGSDALAKRFHS